MEKLVALKEGVEKLQKNLDGELISAGADPVGHAHPFVTMLQEIRDAVGIIIDGLRTDVDIYGYDILVVK